MSAVDWRNQVLNSGILLEPTPDADRIVLWVPGSREHGFQYWQRVSNVVRADVKTEQGACATAATLIRARQRRQGFLGKLFERLGRAGGDATWKLPNGASAEQYGERQNNLLLVWAQDEANPVDEAQIRSHWPHGKEIQRLGRNLFLLSGIEPPSVSREAEEGPPQRCPHEQIQPLVAEAQRRGDRRAEATAQADLGIALIQEGQGQQALAHLEAAFAYAREVGDRARENDVLSYLGLAQLATGQLQPAVESLEQALAYAREAGQPFLQKTALSNLGILYSNVSDPVRAIACFDQALGIARELRDQKQTPELLWQLAIQHAELGQRDRALAYGEETVDFLRQNNKPQAPWFAHHLQKYRSGDMASALSGAGDRKPAANAPIIAGFWTPAVGPNSGLASGGSQPGLLRMAFTAAKSMAQFLGSGFRLAPREKAHQRLRTCASCEHHTGMRCRLCGCFTNAKAWLAHEDCPIGKWPG
jgi:tetratricopeptide (TPR) repeat protein